jgi:hypothetical protein
MTYLTNPPQHIDRIEPLIKGYEVGGRERMLIDPAFESVELPETETVTVQVPVGARQLFVDADLPAGLTYDQLTADLGMRKEDLIEYALLAWPDYVRQMESSGGARDEFFEKVVEYFYDDIGQEDAKLPMEQHQYALSQHADTLVKVVETIDERLSHWMGNDLFTRPEGAPTNVTLAKITPGRCLLNLNYQAQDQTLDIYRMAEFRNRQTGKCELTTRQSLEVVQAYLNESLRLRHYAEDVFEPSVLTKSQEVARVMVDAIYKVAERMEREQTPSPPNDT